MARREKTIAFKNLHKFSIFYKDNNGPTPVNVLRKTKSIPQIIFKYRKYHKHTKLVYELENKILLLLLFVIRNKQYLWALPFNMKTKSFFKNSQFLKNHPTPKFGGICTLTMKLNRPTFLFLQSNYLTKIRELKQFKHDYF